jgi:hypothetical protein
MLFGVSPRGAITMTGIIALVIAVSIAASQGRTDAGVREE